MNEQLIVKNFGPIKDATVDFKRVTVFIGPTGGGKSTLAKLAAIFRDRNSFIKGVPGIIQLIFNYNLRSYFEDDTFLEWTIFPARMLFENGKWKQAFHRTIKDERQEVKRLIAELKTDIDLLNTLISEKDVNDIKPQISDLQFKQAKVNKFIQEYAAPYKPHYVPAERIILPAIGETWPDLIGQKVNLSPVLLSFAKLYIDARKEITSLPLDLFGVEYLFNEGTELIRLSDNKDILLSETASGIQSVTPMLVLLEYLSRNTEQAQSFIIEEPELNLYPTAQQGLLNWLMEKCTKGENDLTITTHSPYILSSCNLLLEAYKVAQLRPDLEDEIAAIVPKACWLNPDDFAAYYVADGTVKPITDERTHLIGGNELDSVSGDISDSFRKLLRLKKQVA